MGSLLSSLLGCLRAKLVQQRQVATAAANKSVDAEEKNGLSSYWTGWSGIIRGRPLDDNCQRMVAELKKLEKQMTPLEKAEKRLWNSSHQRERVDSDQLLKEIQRKVKLCQPSHKNDLVDLQKLDKLHHLRHKKYQVVSTLLRTVVPNNLIPRSGPQLSGSRFWAVVIGVDKYYNDNSLSLEGCTNDAVWIWRYLRDDLSVPSNHIQVLAEGKPLDKSIHPKIPSRKNILRALYDLRNNRSIRQGDSILVYFSGHGSTYPSANIIPSESGTDTDPIEAICPADRGLIKAKKSRPRTLDISDRELNIIFSEIREAKAANLTLILDCSFASPSDIKEANSSRNNAITLTTNIRSASPLQGATQDMLLAADIGRRRIITREAYAEDWNPDLGYVLMAACSDGEQARERTFEDGVTMGVFTRALVSALKTHGSGALTYERLLEAICPLQGQVPVVGGTRTNVAMWTQAAVTDQEMEFEIMAR